MTATIVSPDTIEAAPARRIVAPIPATRLVKVELRKMFNTRSGFWMLVSIGVLSPISAGSLLVFGLNSDVTYQNFVRASGFPMSVILPMIAILAVTNEWSQRTGLTTFTLIPSRGHVIGAKAVEFLVDLTHRSERGCPHVPLTMLVAGTWVDGKTVRAQKRARAESGKAGVTAAAATR